MRKWLMWLMLLLVMSTAQAEEGVFSLPDYDDRLREYSIQAGPLMDEETAGTKAAEIWQAIYGEETEFTVSYDGEYQAWLMEDGTDRGMILTRATGTLVALWNEAYRDPAREYIRSRQKEYTPAYIVCGSFDADEYKERNIPNSGMYVWAVTDEETAARKAEKILQEIFGGVAVGAEYEVYYDAEQLVWLVRQRSKNGTTRCVMLGRVYGSVLGWWEEE